MIKIISYDQVLIGVVANDTEEMSQYFNLFNTFASTIKSRKDKTDAEIITEKARIRFTTKRNEGTLRGWKNHFVINLVQDKEFHNQAVLISTIIHDYLKEDPKWSYLFE